VRLTVIAPFVFEAAVLGVVQFVNELPADVELDIGDRHISISRAGFASLADVAPIEVLKLQIPAVTDWSEEITVADEMLIPCQVIGMLQQAFISGPTFTCAVARREVAIEWATPDEGVVWEFRLRPIIEIQNLIPENVILGIACLRAGERKFIASHEDHNLMIRNASNTVIDIPLNSAVRHVTIGNIPTTLVPVLETHLLKVEPRYHLTNATDFDLIVRVFSDSKRAQAIDNQLHSVA
jgi:hypothetical protein